MIATLIECCKLNGVNPHAWLSVTLSKLAAGHSANQLTELMPWADVG